MKWRLCAAVAALSLLLSGCSSLLARSYTSVTPHSATPPAEGDSSILRVENYQELVNALIYLISLGEEEGTVRMYNYDQDVEQSLSNACLEVVQEDPLGAYSVDFIRYDVTPIVSYYEAAVEITYRRTREQVSAIVAATGATAIRSQLKDLLSSFGTEAALRISSTLTGTPPSTTPWSASPGATGPCSTLLWTPRATLERCTPETWPGPPADTPRCGWTPSAPSCFGTSTRTPWTLWTTTTAS